MKVTILLLSAVVCFAAVNATIPEQPETMNLDLLFDEAVVDDNSELEARGIFRSFFWILKAALRTLKGVNCTIKQVIAIKEATQNFLDNIQSCGDDVVQAFKNVIIGAQSVIAACNDIINTYEKECNNGVSTNGKPKTSFSCSRKLSKRILKLRKQIKVTLNAIKKVPAVPAEAALCSDNAVRELSSVFTSFPLAVQTCSKLTS